MEKGKMKQQYKEKGKMKQQYKLAANRHEVFVNERRTVLIFVTAAVIFAAGCSSPPYHPDPAAAGSGLAGSSSGSEMTGSLSESEMTGSSSEPEVTGSSSGFEVTGLSSGFEVTGLSSESGKTGLSESGKEAAEAFRKEAEKIRKETTEAFREEIEKIRREVTKTEAAESSSAEESTSEETKVEPGEGPKTKSGGGTRTGSGEGPKTESGEGTRTGSSEETRTGSGEESGESRKPIRAASVQSEEPAHEHEWVPVTVTVHHDAVTHTVHQDAVTRMIHHDAAFHEEPIYEVRTICDTCGEDITGQIGEHIGLVCGGSYSEQQIQTGVNIVTDQEAYDEEVIEKEAWDETVIDRIEYDDIVTTGYRCSICGEEKGLPDGSPLTSPLLLFLIFQNSTFLDFPK